MLRLFQIIIMFSLISLSTYGNAAKYVNDGGTNHFIYSYGTADGYNTDYLWYIPIPANIRPPVGTYNLNPNLVNQQILALKASGQTSYVLPIFNSNLGECELSGGCNDGLLDGVWGERIDNSNYSMRPQHRSNLKSIVGKVLDAGFRKIVIRFGYNSDPSTWNSWDENKYQQAWNFIVDVKRAALEEVTYRGLDYLLAPPNNMLIFDLGIEDGGTDNLHQRDAFMKRLWQDYTYTYGVDDTVGFSIAWAPGRFEKQRALLASLLLPLPKMWAVDIYDNASGALAEVYKEMKTLNNQPLIIMETNFNNATTGQEIKSALQTNDLLNISMINQWLKNSPAHFDREIIDSLVNSNTYLNYASLLAKRKMYITSTNSSYLGVKDLTCTQSNSFPCSVELVSSAPPSGKLFGIYLQLQNGGSVLVSCNTNASRLTIPWISTNPNYKFDIYEINGASCSNPKPNPGAVFRATAEATPF